MNQLASKAKPKSTLLLMAFCLSMLYVVVFFLSYVMTADLVAAAVPETTGNFLQVWLPPSLICIVASLLCTSPLLFFKNKLVVPAAFSFIALYTALLFIYAITQEAATREVLVQMILLYLVLPALWGNLFGWGGYLLLRRRKTAKQPRPHLQSN